MDISQTPGANLFPRRCAGTASAGEKNLGGAMTSLKRAAFCCLGEDRILLLIITQNWNISLNDFPYVITRRNLFHKSGQ
jgi:hypothetical protein